MAEETRAGTSEGDSGDLHPGSKLAGHVIEAEIGRGGMGVVYRARTLALERERVLKVIAPTLSADPGFRERFRRESRLAAQVKHPNVVAVHDAGESEGRLFIAMQLVDGDDLGGLVAREGPLEPSRAARLIAEVAGGLDAAHERGLVHRDVKPTNVLVERRGDGERAFLTDFGISRSLASRTALTSAGQILGSADYVAPEQVEGDDVDSRSDVYSLGALACFALSGEPPFPRERELATLYAHANEPPPKLNERRPELPAAIDRVIGTAMAKNPDDRYASAGELAAALAEAAPGRALRRRSAARDRGLAPQPLQPARRRLHR